MKKQRIKPYLPAEVSAVVVSPQELVCTSGTSGNINEMGVETSVLDLDSDFE